MNTPLSVPQILSLELFACIGIDKLTSARYLTLLEESELSLMIDWVADYLDNNEDRLPERLELEMEIAQILSRRQEEDN